MKSLRSMRRCAIPKQSMELVHLKACADRDEVEAQSHSSVVHLVNPDGQNLSSIGVWTTIRQKVEAILSSPSWLGKVDTVRTSLRSRSVTASTLLLSR